MQFGPTPDDAHAHAGDAKHATVMFVRCLARYSGRIDAELELGDRMLFIFDSGAVVLFAMAEGTNPKNWMPKGSIISERNDEHIVFVSPDGTEKLELYIEHIWSEQQWTGTLHGRQVRIGRERELSDLLSLRLDLVEPGLELIGRESRTEVGPIDILAYSHVHQAPVAIEVKRIKSSIGSEVIYQLIRYLDALAREPQWAGTQPRGVLVAPSVSRPARALLERNQMTFVRLTYEDVTANWPDNLAPVAEILGHE